MKSKEINKFKLKINMNRWMETDFRVAIQFRIKNENL